MAKPEWGIKRMCQSCGTRYYDLRRDQPTCPSCGTVFAVKTSVRQRRTQAVEKTDAPAIAPDDKAPATAAKTGADASSDGVDDGAALDVDDDAEDLDAEAKDDSLMEDTSDLGEDDDDMSEVMEHVDDEDMSDRGQ